MKIPYHGLQGVYYYFYQIFRSEAEARARRSKKLNGEDGSVGMLTSLFVAALAGSEFSSSVLSNSSSLVMFRVCLYTKILAFISSYAGEFNIVEKLSCGCHPCVVVFVPSFWFVKRLLKLVVTNEFCIIICMQVCKRFDHKSHLGDRYSYAG